MAKNPSKSGAKPKSGRGGKRPGAGRKKKLYQAPSAITPEDAAAALATPGPAEIDAYVQDDATDTIRGFAHQLLYAASESAKIAAANAILDRGYGKPAVEIGGDAAMQLSFMVPLAGASERPVVTTAEVRAEARRYAVLAVEVLRRIRDKGESDQARVSAGRALLDRGLGTVGKARLPDDLRERPLGKKEEAQRAATAAATGRFAIPAPPSAALERAQ